MEHSPLQKLPEEIRVLVWEYSITPPDNVFHCGHTLNGTGARGCAPVLTVMATCRQICKEICLLCPGRTLVFHESYCFRRFLRKVTSILDLVPHTQKFEILYSRRFRRAAPKPVTLIREENEWLEATERLVCDQLGRKMVYLVEARPCDLGERNVPGGSHVSVIVTAKQTLKHGVEGNLSSIERQHGRRVYRSQQSRKIIKIVNLSAHGAKQFAQISHRKPRVSPPIGIARDKGQKNKVVIDLTGDDD